MMIPYQCDVMALPHSSTDNWLITMLLMTNAMLLIALSGRRK